MHKAPTYKELEQRVETLEKKLQESEAGHKALMENIQDGVYSLNTEGLFTFVNDVIVERSGQSPEWFYGRTYLDVIRAEDRERVKNHFETIMRGEKAPIYELAYPNASGNEQWVEVNTTPVWKNGRVDGLYGVSRDITQRKKAEGAMRYRETRYRAVVENQVEMICCFLADGTITFVNEAYCRYFEKNQDALIGHKFLSLIPERDREMVFKEISSLTPNVPLITLEHQVIAPSGKVCWQKWTNRAIFDDRDNLVEYQSVGWDITERVWTEKALRESEERYRLLVETMNEGLGIQDSAGLISYVNDKFCEMLNYRSNELIGRPVTDFLDGTNKQILMDQIPERKAGKAEPYQLEWTKKDGSRLPTIMSPRAIIGDKGNFKGSFAVITDISTLEEVRKALKRALDKTEQQVNERTKELKIKTRKLEEINTALNLLLERRDKDNKALSDQVLNNVKSLIVPYLKKLKESGVDDKQKVLMNIVESNLNEIISPFAHRLSSNYFSLTPSEIKVADLVRQGKKTKEIAAMLDISHKTIERHRENIRSKMGLKNKKVHLRTYLLSLH